MKTVIHVNQHIVKRNAKTGALDPVLTVKTYKSNNYGHEAIIYGQDGKEAARVIYRPDKPLSCGAHVWIETQQSVLVVRDEGGLRCARCGWTFKDHSSNADSQASCSGQSPCGAFYAHRAFNDEEEEA